MLQSFLPESAPTKRFRDALRNKRFSAASAPIATEDERARSCACKQHNVCDGCGQTLDRRRRGHVLLGPIVHTRVWRRLADDPREQLCIACMDQRALERFGRG
jgi:hypothetical protein